MRLAMLASDVEALDELIADDLILVGPSGDVFHKQDDLALHRSGRQKLTLAEWDSVEVTVRDQVAVTTVAAHYREPSIARRSLVASGTAGSGSRRTSVGRCWAVLSSPRPEPNSSCCLLPAEIGLPAASPLATLCSLGDQCGTSNRNGIFHGASAGLSIPGNRAHA